MKALDRKLLRDMARMRAQLIAIILVVACGVASYVTMLSVHRSLEASGEAYFRLHRLPHVFARSQRAPLGVAERMRDIADVGDVETRIVKEVTLDVPGLPEPANGRIIGASEDGQSHLGRLHLERGRWLTPGRADEVIVSAAFADANALEPGDELVAILSGHRQRLEIVGVALSPEYVFQMAAGAMLPDDRRFGVLWMSRSAVAAAFDMEGAFNDVVLALRADASLDPVLMEVDRLLAPYGGIGAHGRDKQMSFRFVRDELAQLESMGAVMPTIFLGVAAFLLNVVMSRMIGGQREQIAALKALGYGNFPIGAHFAKLVLLVALLGTLLGTATGAWMGRGLITVYHQFFRFPALVFELDRGVVLDALLLTVGAGLVGTFRPVRKAVSLPPAEAMRPAAPESYGKSLFERLGLGLLFGPAGRIVLRNLSRHPARMLSSVVGIALAIAILISGSFSADALELVMRVNFEVAQRDDVTVTFSHALSDAAIDELEQLPGVLYAEGSREVPVRLRSGVRDYETAIQGLPEDGKLRRIIDERERETAIPPSGLLLTRELGARLALEVGDTVTVEVLDGARPTRYVEVAGFVDEMVGLSAYMNLDAVRKLLDEGPRVTSARLLIDAHERDRVYLEIKALPHVAGATLRSAAFEIFNETSAQMQMMTRAILVAFAGIVAVGVVYNGARVVLAERSRELASLRVLGFTRAEISTILLGELLIQLLLAGPLGAWLGWLLAYGAIAGIDTELYRFPLVILPRTYAFAIGSVWVAGIVAALVVRQKLDHLDLVEVLKTRE